MRLADFIEQHATTIVEGAERFARTQAPAGTTLDPAALRDHIPQILKAIVLDLRSPQTRLQQHLKSEGRAIGAGGGESAATSHGRIRAKVGFDVNHMVAEYRALRAAVIQLWAADKELVAESMQDMVRFNEAIDQAVAESLAEFSRELESWRQVFLGALGHDLRGPLGVVLCAADLLEQSASGSPYAKHVDRITHGAEHMRRLLDELLDYSRSKLGMAMVIHRIECDLAQELREEVEAIRMILPDAPLEFVAEGATRGEFDCLRIREAIHNLVANAAKYGNPGSDIVIRVRGEASQVQITVSNWGPPLQDSFIGTMFDPLRRGPQKAAAGENSSLGLGLFIVREIARAHGGRVEAGSSGGQTKFELFLPR